MTGTLLVTPSELKAAASSFQDKGNQVRTLTQNMTSKVAELTGRVWSGDAASKYIAQFNGLQDDINRMVGMITEHVSDLNEMASAYEKAESENQSAAASLSSDVFV